MKLSLAALLFVAVAQATLHDFKPIHRTRPVLPTAPQPKINLGQRIINGDVAFHGQFPYQAGLFINGNTFCGGSLISVEFILTAAHCAVDARSVEVYLGSQNVQLPSETGRVVASVSGITVHEDYDANYIVNDIAVMKLEQYVYPSTYIGTIQLDNSSNSYVDSNATVIGWGKISDSAPSITDELRYVSLPIISNSECNSYYGTIGNGQICADGYYGSSCYGDSGGPLVSQRVQIGIVSFGSSSGCASGYPSVYTRVSAYRDWISQNAGV